MPAKSTKAPSGTSMDRWENEGGPSALAPSEATESELEKLGIRAVRMTVFHWGGYRYSNSRDAIAAAKRQSRAGSD